ncbi:interleukin-17C [Micropterus salmoides]|uniref:interleukin-17C n=1 Tax=Micropterus salmoides TaxID=27706 RepID=UPI0018ED0D13|nr:interleukin-17C [Micropterus salmoides]
MDINQILIIGLFLVPAWTHGMHQCYDEDKLRDAAERKLRRRFQQPVEPVTTAAPDSPASCPLELYRHKTPKDLHERSLSPWRYVRKTMEDHFPSTYTEAQCLCSGCILIQENRNSVGDKRHPVESHDYNSVPIKQSRVFLKRELCYDKKRYHLKPVTVDVAVGCTCARVKTSSSS